MSDTIASEADDPASHMLHILQSRSTSAAETGLAAADEWTTAAWLGSLGLSSHIAAALHGGTSPSDQLGATRRLIATMPSTAELADHLRSNHLLESLAHVLQPHLQQLMANSPSDAAGSASGGKYVQAVEGFTLRYGDLSTFFGGLEAKIGTPNPKIRHAMAAEHTASDDSADEFVTGNYAVTTTPQLEWAFVVAPDSRDLAAWPREQRLQGMPHLQRQPMALDELKRRVADVNTKLDALHEPTMLEEEAVGARLYTGPMFVKYNDLLRGFGAALAGCKGNRYVTTNHVINSAIVKASKLTRATKVFRGIAGGLLPESFRTPNEFGVKGGIEAAFMSTTFDRAVALHYASQPGQPGIVFEMQMGMIDRGAQLDWLSQYPHERECLFAPLTGLEVVGTRCEGAVLVIEARLSINLNALTIEQVTGKRRKLLSDMASNMEAEVCAGLGGSGFEAIGPTLLRNELRDGALQHAAEWYNDDDHFEGACKAVLEAKRHVLGTEPRLRLLQKHTDLSAHAAAIEPLLSHAERPVRELAFELLLETGETAHSLRGKGHEVFSPEDWKQGGRAVWELALNVDHLGNGDRADRLVLTEDGAVAVCVGGQKSEEEQLEGKSSVVEPRTTISIVHLKTGGELTSPKVTRLEGHQGRCSAVALDGDLLASADNFGNVILWSLSSGERLRDVKVDNTTLYGLALRGEMLYASGRFSQIFVWYVGPEKRAALAGKRKGEYEPLRGHKSEVCSLAANATLLVSGSADSTARVWSLAADGMPNVECLHVLQHPEDEAVNCVCINEGRIATACCDAAVRVWSAADGTLLHKCQHGRSTAHIDVGCLSLMGTLLVSGGHSNDDKSVKVWSLKGDEPECVATLQGSAGSGRAGGHRKPVIGVAISSHGTLLSLGQGKDGMRLWRCK